MVNLKAWYHVSKKPCPIPWLVHQKAERIAWRNYITRWLFQVQYFPFLPYFEQIFSLKLLQGVEATRLGCKLDIYLLIYIYILCKFVQQSHVWPQSTHSGKATPNLLHSPRAQLMLDACSVLEAHGELHIVFWQMAEIHPGLDGASRNLKGWGYSLMKGRQSTTRITVS